MTFDILKDHFGSNRDTVIRGNIMFFKRICVFISIHVSNRLPFPSSCPAWGKMFRMSSCCRDLRKGREMRKKKTFPDEKQRNMSDTGGLVFRLALSPPESKLRCSNRWHVFYLFPPLLLFPLGRSGGRWTCRASFSTETLDSSHLPFLPSLG